MATQQERDRWDGGVYDDSVDTPLTQPYAEVVLRKSGSSALATDKQHALQAFRTCAEDPWWDATREPPDLGSRRSSPKWWMCSSSTRGQARGVTHPRPQTGGRDGRFLRADRA